MWPAPLRWSQVSQWWHRGWRPPVSLLRLKFCSRNKLYRGVKNKTTYRPLKPSRGHSAWHKSWNQGVIHHSSPIHLLRKVLVWRVFGAWRLEAAALKWIYKNHWKEAHMPKAECKTYQFRLLNVKRHIAEIRSQKNTCNRYARGQPQQRCLKASK